MDIGIKTWRRNDWTSFILIFLVLILHLLFVGYPIIAPDSGRYLRAAIFLRGNPYCPTLVCYLISPLVMLLGAWGFAIFQMAILTYTLVSTLRFFNKNATIGIISIIMSVAGFIAVTVMMDIYTTIGLLALFLILNGNRDIILHLILGLCFVAHYGNVLLFPACAVIYWLIFARKRIGKILIPIFLFVIFVLLASLINYGLEEDFRFLSTAKYSFMAGRIMIDSPEITRAYMSKYPDSKLAKHRQEYEDIILQRRRIGSLMWDEGGLFNKFGGNVKFNSDAKKFIVYALQNHTGTLLRSISYGIYRFLIRPIYRQALIRSREPLVKHIERFIPRQTEQMRKSLQYSDGLGVINFEFFYRVCYYLSLLVTSTFLILSIWFPKMRKTNYFSFAVFAILLLFFNALIFSTIGGLSGRGQVRVLLLPCLAACLIISDILNKLFFIFSLSKKSEDIST